MDEGSRKRRHSKMQNYASCPLSRIDFVCDVSFRFQAIRMCVCVLDWWPISEPGWPDAHHRNVSKTDFPFIFVPRTARLTGRFSMFVLCNVAACNFSSFFFYLFFPSLVESAAKQLSCPLIARHIRFASHRLMQPTDTCFFITKRQNPTSIRVCESIRKINEYSK